MPGTDISTRVNHSGTKPSDWAHSPIMAPIYLTTNFEVREPGNCVYDYSRSDNPTRTELQKLLASVESSRYGLAFSSGLGAMSTIVDAILKPGMDILCCDDVYGGSYRLFNHCKTSRGIETTYVDPVNIENWVRGFSPGRTKLVWIETPTNPLLKVIDIEGVAAAIKELDKECVVVVDNTFMTPVFQTPLKFGADIVLHSCSKFLGGHSDIIMGSVMLNNESLYKKLKFCQNAFGITPSSFDCWLMCRSLRTLEVRVRQQAHNAMKIAEYLESHSNVDRVIYPGLKSHPQHNLVAKQCSGFGSMISVYIKTNRSEEPKRFVQAVELFHCTESLGCVCSYIEIPALMTHMSVPEATRAKLGITENLLRLSIGLENVEGLIQDLQNAFESVYN